MNLAKFLKANINLLSVLISVSAMLAACHRPTTAQTNATTVKTDTLETEKPPLDVSMISLIANPNKYKGKKVRLIGYLNLAFESDGLYLHEEDYLHGLTKNALWIEILRDSLAKPSVRKCIKHYVLVEGTFSELQGHMSAFSASIENITRLEPWNEGGTPAPPTQHYKVLFPPSK
ncbi:MAG: hypothetical protein V4577_11690 [Bacteroidota bacterium]